MELVFLIFLLRDLRNIKGDITSFSVSGIEYSPKSKIISLINLNKGRALSDILVVNIIKELYALNLFENIQVNAESVGVNQVKLHFQFVEKNRIDSIRFEGNNKISEKKFMDLSFIQTRQFEVVTKYKFK